VQLASPRLAAAPERLRVLLIAAGTADAGRLAVALTAGGAAVTLAATLAAADAEVRSGGQEVITLALAGWEAEALELLIGWRTDGLKSPVLLLTEPVDLQSGVRGLNVGADSFLPQSTPASALLAHLRALARWSGTAGEGAVLRIHDLEIETASGTVRRGGRPVALTPQEQSVLDLLARHAGIPVSRRQIEEHLYGPGANVGPHTVATCIKRLRGKLDRGAAFPLILTRRGEGYLLRGEGADAEAGAAER
jgi:DNA-binding response OmpR family regulator